MRCVNHTLHRELIDVNRRFVFASFKQFIVLLLGFASGLPLALSASTLQAWYAVSGVDIITIGSLALVGQPYMFKFLWAPVLDYYIPPLLGRRRGWMVLTQIVLIITLLVMSQLNPTAHPGWLAMVACALAFASATQDVAIDAYRAEILQPEERGLGAAMAVGGYRLGMLFSGGFALLLASKIQWQATYQLMALTMLVGGVASIIAPRPAVAEQAPLQLHQAVVLPVREFFSRPHAWEFIALIVLFKLGETFTSTSGIMTNPFLLQGMHFSLATVGMVNKVIGVGAVLFGIFLGGILLTRISLFYALAVFGLLQGISNLSYAVLSIVGKSFTVLVITVLFDNVSAGLGNAAIIALLMGLCDARFTATQFALLSAIAISGRVLLGPLAGWMVAELGWTQFFIWTFFMALPGVFLAWWMRNRVEHLLSPSVTISS